MVPQYRNITKTQAVQMEIQPWDDIAEHRAHSLDGGKDLTLNHISVPTILELLAEKHYHHILDAGCGVGRLTKHLTTRAQHVTGVDPSKTSIEHAEKYLNKTNNVTLHNTTVEQYAHTHANNHDAVISLMVLQDVINLKETLKALYETLQPGGILVGAITHPQHFPVYRGYVNEPWFDYNKELFIKSEFHTTLTRSNIETLHVHRPIKQYLDTLTQIGFTDTKLTEPLLDIQLEKQHIKWDTAHLLFFKTQKPHHNTP